MCVQEGFAREFGALRADWVRVGVAVQRRRAGQPAEVVAIAERAQHRLHRRFWRLVSTGKPRNKALVAVAREFAGFIWAVLDLHTAHRAEVAQAA